MIDRNQLGGRIKNRYLLAVDCFVLLVVPAVALYLRTENLDVVLAMAVPLAAYTAAMLAFKMSVFLSLAFYSHYWAYEANKELELLFQAMFFTFVGELLLAFGVLFPTGLIPEEFPHALPLIGAFLTTTCVAGVRLPIHLAFSRAPHSASHTDPHPTLVVGAGRVGSMVVDELLTNQQLRLSPIAFLDDDPQKLGTHVHGVPVIGRLPDLHTILKHHKVEHVIIAMPKAPGRVVRKVSLECREAGVQSMTVPGVSDILRWWQTFFQRLFDLAISGLGLILFSPLFAFLAIAIKITSRGPILYSQTRVGRHRRLFRVHKFRSMIPDAETVGTSVTTALDNRITPIGRFLRKTKLDELPQLWNVFLGEMSLVGPRPDVPDIVSRYNSEMLRIFDIRPGITSNASIHLRQEEALLALSSVPDEAYEVVLVPYKVALAMEHVDRESFLFDVKVFWKTLWELTAGRFNQVKPDSILELVQSDIREFKTVPTWGRAQAARANWIRYSSLMRKEPRTPVHAIPEEVILARIDNGLTHHLHRAEISDGSQPVRLRTGT